MSWREEDIELASTKIYDATIFESFNLFATWNLERFRSQPAGQLA